MKSEFNLEKDPYMRVLFFVEKSSVISCLISGISKMYVENLKIGWNNSLKNFKNILQVLLLSIAFLLLESAAVVVTIIYKDYTDPAYTQLLLETFSQMSDPDKEVINTYMQLIYEIVPMEMQITGIIVFVPLFIYLKVKQKHLGSRLDVVSIAQLISLGLILNIGISYIIDLLPDGLLNNYNSTTEYLYNIPFIPLILAIGVVTPIIEELFFRYFMVGKLRDKKWIAIVLPALTFGIAHGNIVQGTYAFILGLFFGYLFYATNNLYITSLLHITINSSSVVFVFCPEIIVPIFIVSLIVFVYLYLKNGFLLKEFQQENVYP